MDTQIETSDRSKASGRGPGIKQKALPRIIPFALFMIFIGGEEIARFLHQWGRPFLSDQILSSIYPVKILCVAIVLFLFRKHFQEIHLPELTLLSKSVISLITGLIVFALWIKLDWTFGPLSHSSGFNPHSFVTPETQTLMIVFRLAGAVLVVPIMEELFWRSFMLRYLIDSDFSKIPLGQFSWASFLISAALFGLEHHLILAGVMAGIAYNLLLYYTRSITHCIFAHAITNLTLGLYVLATGRWYFW